MTVYFDVNVLIHATMNQGVLKMQFSQSLIHEAIKNESFILSPLSIQEYVFTLKKLKIETAEIYEKASVFLQYCNCSLDCRLLHDAVVLASKIDYFRNINDIIHLKYAEKYASKLVTFDTDFERLKPHTDIEIEILKV